jgi:hypothetical protein
MKITRSDGSVMEGNPEEIAQYEALRATHAVTANGVAAPPAGTSAELVDWEYASLDVAFRTLTRIKLGKETRQVLSQIYAGGKAWTFAPDLQSKINFTPSQFAGLMGAFGRRFVNTPGYVFASSFFEQEWDADRSCNKYRLPPSVRAAVEKARIVN